jgi:arabinose-5-phosphate isomerase
MDTLLEEARVVIRRECEALEELEASLDDSFCRAVHLIHAAEGRVIVTGVGKSGLIGRKIAATLASTGTPAFFIHAAEALHGDLGMVTAQDVVLMVSHSGETAELVAMQAGLLRMGVAMIAIVGRCGSRIGRNCTVEIPTGVCQEADHLNLAPTCSTTAALVLGDALALILSREKEFTREDFARCHPGGSLGRLLAGDKGAEDDD